MLSTKNSAFKVSEGPICINYDPDYKSQTLINLAIFRGSWDTETLTPPAEVLLFSVLTFHLLVPKLGRKQMKAEDRSRYHKSQGNTGLGFASLSQSCKV